jgi:hypothetical protein
MEGVTMKASYEWDPNTNTHKWSISLTELLIKLIDKDAPDKEREFFDVSSFLKDNRGLLAELAIEFYKYDRSNNAEQIIIGINLLGKSEWIPSKPIDLQLGETTEIALEYQSKQPSLNPLIYNSNFLPWDQNYVKNIEILNEKIIKQYDPPDDLKPKLFNASIYQLVKTLSFNNKTKFVCCRNKYYSYMNNCELLHFEFAHAVWKNFIKKGKQLNAKKIKTNLMPFRKTIDLLNFENRCVGIGINTIFIMKESDNITFFKHKRTPGATMEAINTEHVVPAGTFQPRREMPEYPDLDFNIYCNILRELGEELLGRKELEEIKSSTEDIRKEDLIKNYHQLFVEGYASAFFLGWGIDPLTTKAEFLTAMIVNIDEYKKRFGDINFKHNWEGKPFLFQFHEECIVDFINNIYTLPAGAGCAKLAWNSKDILINSIK